MTEPDAHLPAELQLERALHLLRQAGYGLPEGEGVSRGAWLQSLIDGLCELSSRDALTGLANRRQFELALSSEIDRVARTGEYALVLLLDIDFFKLINDRFGHAAGDLVIQRVAQQLQDCVRPMDTVARVGGEEFAVILPNCPPAFGQTVAERIRHRIASQRITLSPGQEVQITTSVGGAFAPQWVRSSAKIWMQRADQQLYAAKASGRNRACLELPPVPVVSAEEKGLLFGMGPYLVPAPIAQTSPAPLYPETDVSLQARKS
jgi:diguanylate cyclase (GGDEF)-like protein